MVLADSVFQRGLPSSFADGCPSLMEEGRERRKERQQSLSLPAPLKRTLVLST